MMKEKADQILKQIIDKPFKSYNKKYSNIRNLFTKSGEEGLTLIFDALRGNFKSSYEKKDVYDALWFLLSDLMRSDPALFINKWENNLFNIDDYYIGTDIPNIDVEVPVPFDGY